MNVTLFLIQTELFNTERNPNVKMLINFQRFSWLHLQDHRRRPEKKNSLHFPRLVNLDAINSCLSLTDFFKNAVFILFPCDVVSTSSFPAPFGIRFIICLQRLTKLPMNFSPESIDRPSSTNFLFCNFSKYKFASSFIYLGWQSYEWVSPHWPDDGQNFTNSFVDWSVDEVNKWKTFLSIFLQAQFILLYTNSAQQHINSAIQLLWAGSIDETKKKMKEK